MVYVNANSVEGRTTHQENYVATGFFTTLLLLIITWVLSTLSDFSFFHLNYLNLAMFGIEENVYIFFLTSDISYKFRHQKLKKNE